MVAVYKTALLVLLTVGFVGCSGSQNRLIPHEGFDDIVWGVPMDEVAGMALAKKKGGRWTWAIRHPERLRIGDADVDSITYLFIDGMFAGVDMTFSGIERFGLLKEEMEKSFGQPSIVNKKMRMLAWNLRGTTILLRYYRHQGVGTLKYTLDNMT